MHLLEYLQTHADIPVVWNGAWVSPEQSWSEYQQLHHHFLNNWTRSASSELAKQWGAFMAEFPPLDWPNLMAYFEHVPSASMPEQLRAVVEHESPHNDKAVRATQALYRTRKHLPLTAWLNCEDLLASLDTEHSIEILQGEWQAIRDNTRMPSRVVRLFERTQEFLKHTFETIKVENIPHDGVGPLVAFVAGMTEGVPYCGKYGDEVSFAQERLSQAPASTIARLLHGIERGRWTQDTLNEEPWCQLFSTHPLLKTPLSIGESLGVELTPKILLGMMENPAPGPFDIPGLSA
jgi:hypothetical protein